MNNSFQETKWVIESFLRWKKNERKEGKEKESNKELCLLCQLKIESRFHTGPTGWTWPPLGQHGSHRVNMDPTGWTWTPKGWTWLPKGEHDPTVSTWPLTGWTCPSTGWAWPPQNEHGPQRVNINPTGWAWTPQGEHDCHLPLSTTFHTASQMTTIEFVSDLPSSAHSAIKTIKNYL